MGLQCTNLLKTFDNFTVITNLKADSGTLVTLLGPSGCGKTTTLQLIAGILKPDNGKIFLHGKDISDAAPWKRNIGMVFQDYALFPHMNVFKNVQYGLQYRKMNRDEIRTTVLRYLDLVRLGGYENRSIESLSGGEKQRVALARALAPAPRLLLLDEPLSALDSGLRKNLRREIRRIQQQLSITAVYVTHDQEEALTISDKIVIMNNGKIEQTGSPEKIYNNPSTKFTADFLGSSNLLSGMVTSISKTEGITVRCTKPDVIFHVPFQKNIVLNEPVWIFFRSKYTHLVTDKPGSNCFSGVVTCGEYYGTYHLYEMDVTGRTILAEQPITETVRERIKNNKKVLAGVAPEHCYLIKKSAASNGHIG